MNNKLLFSLMLSVFFPIIASEASKSILDEKITAYACVKYKSSSEGQTNSCMIVGKHDQLAVDDLQQKSVTYKMSEFSIKTMTRDKDGIFQIGGISSMLAGVPTKDFEIVVLIENKNNIFQQRIKHCYDLYTKDSTPQDSFSVHLEEKKAPNIISLKFTEDQVKQIISMKKPSAMRSILVGLGFAGLVVALVYYFNRHSKGMTLLGRG